MFLGCTFIRTQCISASTKHRRVTDKQTDGLTEDRHLTTLCIASSGKNQCFNHHIALLRSTALGIYTPNGDNPDASHAAITNISGHNSRAV